MGQRELPAGSEPRIHCAHCTAISRSIHPYIHVCLGCTDGWPGSSRTRRGAVSSPAERHPHLAGAGVPLERERLIHQLRSPIALGIPLTLKDISVEVRTIPGNILGSTLRLLSPALAGLMLSGCGLLRGTIGLNDVSAVQAPAYSANKVLFLDPPSQPLPKDPDPADCFN